jgi:hypothetical protein
MNSPEIVTTPSPLSKADIDALRDAVRRLESQGFAVRAAQLLGSPIAKGIEVLPQKYGEVVQNAARQAIEKSLDVAVNSLGRKGPLVSGNGLHKLAAGASGAIGGFFGLAALPVELPVSTTIMMRSIAEIARGQGEDLATAESRLACIEVFALDTGTRRVGDEAGYYAIRAGLAQIVREAASQVAERGVARESSSAVVRFVAQVAARFGVTVSDKVLAQAVPVIGAAAGSAINVIFTDYFQSVATGHFAVRRLERRYGERVVRLEYERIRRELGL